MSPLKQRRSAAIHEFEYVRVESALPAAFHHDGDAVCHLRFMAADRRAIFESRSSDRRRPGVYRFASRLDHRACGVHRRHLFAFITQFADRHFSAQRFLGVLMICGGMVKLITVQQTTFPAWLALSVVFAMLFMPAAAICNALAMRHLANPTRQFAGVRLWSTVGWISVAWFFPLIALKTNVSFQWLPPFFRGDDVDFVAAKMLTSVRWSGMLAIRYGLFAFFILPDTPPVKTERKRFAAVEAFAMLRRPSFGVMLIVTLMLSVTHVNYFVQMSSFLKVIGLDDAYIMPVMSVGQGMELLMYAILGRLLIRFGFRTILILGSLAFAARFALHGTTDLPIAIQIAGQAFHGICYAFVFGTCFIYVDRLAPKEIKNSAQSVYNFVFYGIGPFVAVQVNSVLAHRLAGENGLDVNGFRAYWYAMAGIGLLACIIMTVCFRDETIDQENQTT